MAENESLDLFGTGILSDGEPTEPIARLLATYRDEWRSIITQAQARSISWTKLVGRRTSSREGADHALV